MNRFVNTKSSLHTYIIILASLLYIYVYISCNLIFIALCIIPALMPKKEVTLIPKPGPTQSFSFFITGRYLRSCTLLYISVRYTGVEAGCTCSKRIAMKSRLISLKHLTKMKSKQAQVRWLANRVQRAKHKIATTIQYKKTSKYVNRILGKV